MMFQIIFVLTMLTLAAPALAGPLHDAAREGDLGKVRALIDEGAVIDAQSERGETPLTLAILAGQGKVVELLLEGGPRSPDAMPAASRPCTRRATLATLRLPSC
jgi:ankyrin repeat protein